MEKVKPLKKIRHWGLMVLGCVIGILNPMGSENIEASKGLGGPSHIGTFEGSTTFTTSSSNGINPGLYLEVIDEYGNYTEYTSEEGVITLPNTQEGAYITQAKLLGKTKYRDQETGELLDQWEAGRNLKLESVEGPGLKTTGKNLANTTIASGLMYYDSGRVYQSDLYYVTDFIKIPSNAVYSFNMGQDQRYCLFDSNKKYITGLNAKTFNSGDASFVRFSGRSSEVMMIEGSTPPTSYEPYQSNCLTVNGNLELRGIGDVQDTLDLLTGEVTERIGEIVLDGSENWSKQGVSQNNSDLGIYYSTKALPNTIFNTNNVLCDKFKTSKTMAWHSSEEDIYVSISTYGLKICFDERKLESTTVEGFKKWLSENTPTIQYPLVEKPIKTVSLNSTYYFQPVLNRSVEVNGTVLPLVYSVTVPTDPLSFVLNPNAEEGQRFIAPTFTITNDTPASIQIELKAFEQTTNTFRDVLPTKYEDWNQLSKDQSKDFALALLPVPSEGWASLKEGPRYVADSSNRYVADSSNYDLGEIKAESSVDFTFTASHGRAFVERLNPQYRLSFMFGF